MPITEFPIPTKVAVKGDIGLGNVDNTSDLNKPVSNLTAAALSGKSDIGHTHANATDESHGFMSLSDKAKLTGIATGATANSSDATLLNRANHTGAQAINTVTGLQAALDDKASVATAAAKQIGIQFQDEGGNLGASGSAAILNFTGAGVTVTRVGDTVSIAIPNTAIWSLITGNPLDNPDLVAVLGGTDAGGPSDVAVSAYDGNSRVSTYTVDGLGWTAGYHTDGRIDTLTSGALVRQYVYDGPLRYTGITGPKYQGGRLVLTWAQMAALTPSTSGLHVTLSDTYPGQELRYDASRWRSPSGTFLLGESWLSRILWDGTAATYSQTTTTVTVTQTGHGMTADLNGASIYLTQSTGALVTGWFTNFLYIDANSFSCTSTVSQTTSGNLGAQTGADITLDSITVKGKLLGPNGRINSTLGFSFRDNANNKQVKLKFGGSTVFNPTFNDKASNTVEFNLMNAGATNKQKGWVTSNDLQVGTSDSGGWNRYSVDTQSDVTLAITGQLSTATTFLVLEGYSFVITH